MKKWIYIGLGIALLGAGGYYGYVQYFKKEPVLTVPLQTAVAAKGDLKVTVSGSGTVTTASSKEIKANEAGEIGALPVKEGETVKQGQVLAAYAPPDVGDQIVQTESAIKKSELQLDQLKRKYMEAQNDDARGDIQIQIESLKLDMQASRDSMAALEEQQGKKDLIVAPIGGKITSLAVEAGQKVQENMAIATVVDYQHLQSVIQIDELDVAKVKVGQKATITLDALAGTEIEGTVTKVADEGAASNGVSLFDVTISFTAQDGVKVGMTTSADILIESKQNVLMVPVEAIRDRGGAKMVLVASAAGGPGGAAGAGAAGAGQAAAPNRQAADRVQSGQGAQNGQGGSGGASGGAARGGASGFGSQRAAKGNAGQGGFRRQNAGQAGAAGAAGAAGQGTLREVTVGIANDGFIEVLSGLNEGDRVILPTVAVSSSRQGQAFPGGAFGPGGFGGGGAFPGGGGIRAGAGGGPRGGNG